MGENLSKVYNFEKVKMLISINQLEPIEEMFTLEVGIDKFPVRAKELGWMESTGDGIKEKGVDEGMSESESVAGTAAMNLMKDSQNV